MPEAGCPRTRARLELAAGFAGFFVSMAAHSASPTTATPSTAPLPHVRYFADGIEIPLGTMAQVVKGIKECSRRFPDCRAALNESAGDSMAAIDTVFDLGPLFAATLAQSPTPPTPSTLEGLKNLAALSKRSNSEARAFERQFVKRYATVLYACSDDYREEMAMLGSLLRIDVLHFEGGTESDFKRLSKSTLTESKQKVRRLKEQWSATTCQNALVLGHAMSRAYWHKLDPYRGDNWREVKDNKNELLTGSLWEMAYWLAVEHDPSVATRIDEYYRAKETAAKD
jgi:hypothetical protein